MNFLTAVTSGFPRRKAAQTAAASVYTFAKTAIEQNPHTYTRSDMGEVGFFLRKKSSMTILSQETALRILL
jgi:hypothetical protein